MSARARLVSFTEISGTLALTILLNGLLLWHFLPFELSHGYRALSVAMLAALLQIVLAIQPRLRMGRTQFKLLLALGLQAAVLTASLIYGAFTEYGVWKLQAFVMLGLMPAAFLIWNYAQRPKRIELFLRVLFAVSLLPLGLPVVYPELLEPGLTRWTLTESGVDLIGVSRSVGVATLLAGVFVAHSKGWRRLGLVLITLLLVCALIGIGERAPLLAALVGITYLFGYGVPGAPRGKQAVKMLVAGIASAATLIAMLIWLPRFSLEAFAADGRWSIFSVALSQVNDTPIFGTGLGAFHVFGSPAGMRVYVHNLVGELVAETGFLGLISMLVLFCVPLFKFAVRASELPSEVQRWLRASQALLLYAIVNACFSGDIATNYLVWTSWALVLCFRGMSLRAEFAKPETRLA